MRHFCYSLLSALVVSGTAFAQSNAEICRLMGGKTTVALEAYFQSHSPDLNVPCNDSIGFGDRGQYPLQIQLRADLQNGSFDVSRLLIEKGASFEATRSDGTNIFLSSLENIWSPKQLLEFISFAKEVGTNLGAVIQSPSLEYIRAQYRPSPLFDRSGMNALMILATTDVFERMARSARREEDSRVRLATVLDLLLGKVEINAKDVYGRTALHHAADNQRSAVSELLIKRGADPKIADNAGLTPFDYILASKNEELLTLLSNARKIQNPEIPGDTSQDSVSTQHQAGISQASQSNAQPPAQQSASPVSTQPSLEGKVTESERSEVSQSPGREKAPGSLSEPESPRKSPEQLYDAARVAANSLNFRDARVIWETLAAGGHAAATFQLGRMYARGDGVSRNFEKARGYFAKAADLGNADACFAMGLMYLRGDGVPIDKNVARKYLEKAKRLGNTKADGLLRNIS